MWELRAASARALWQAIPENYPQKAKIYSDDWQAYKKVIPPAQQQFSKQKKDTEQPLPINLSRTGGPASSARFASELLAW